ncbi:HlyD family type I secretion periplasmic adaptor subunit [Spartinivicinus ruber]|uniref:HlyD family type I secretion periplasmic adaptor subunit n=1 Tax=Spartinivicinus ruber TaxID=2683272 RepID=UPI001CA4160D|nr:HlyD family type I secretion periplasmic adaptor subunit [Spartinivicinus ruber]
MSSMGSHLKTAAAAYQQLKNEPEPIKRQRHEYEFLPAYLEVTDKPPAPLSRKIAWGICGLLLLAVLWASLGHIDIIASATGKIMVSSRTKVIQPLETAVISAIHVRDGQSVKKGDVLIELNPTGAVADTQRLKEQLLFAQLDAARLRALLSDEPKQNFIPPKDALSNQVEEAEQLMMSQYGEKQAIKKTYASEIKQNQAQQSSTQTELTSRKKVLKSINKRLSAQHSLVKRDAFPKIQYLELEEEKLQLESDLAVLESRLLELKAAAVNIIDRRNQAVFERERQWRQQLSEAEKTISQSQQELIKAKERARLQTLVAPVTGVVQELAVHTIGGVVSPAQTLMVVVPEDALLEAEALVLNKDVGFVIPGQEVEIKIDSFPYTKYGTIRGVISNVSRDAVENEQLGLVFPARVEMETDQIMVDGHAINLAPGMTITAEIKTGERRVIEYLLSPLQEYQSEALKER